MEATEGALTCLRVPRSDEEAERPGGRGWELRGGKKEHSQKWLEVPYAPYASYRDMRTKFKVS